MKIVNKTISEYSERVKFDLITCFAFVQYLDEQEAINFYKKYIKYLKPAGKIIVKNQFGVKEDVTISGFSSEMNKNYYSQYRYINKEVEILENCGYRNPKVFDIYPPQCNRWDNTHFYAIVAEK